MSAHSGRLSLTAVSRLDIDEPPHSARLELAVPFTTPVLTRAALRAAESLAAGLNAIVRLIRIQIAPWPLEPDRSPVPIAFLEEQMSQMRAGLPIEYEVRIVRDFDAGLTGALGAHSVVVLAAPRRMWKTRNERLADRLRRAGHTVIVVPEVPAPKTRESCSTSSTAF